MLCKIEGMVTQRVDNHWVEMMDDTEPLANPSKAVDGPLKYLQFTGTEAWQGKKVDLSELVGRHIRCYGWEDPENAFCVLAIKVMTHPT